MTRLLYERRRRGWSQLTLGYHAKVQPSDLSRIESGRLHPYPTQRARLAAALGLEPASLLDDVVEEPVSARSA